MFKRGLCICMALALLAGLCGDLTDEFMTKVMAAPDSATRQALVDEYLPRMSSVEDHRSLQGIWLSLNREACLSHYQKLLTQNPQDPKYKYLVLRTAEGAQQLDDARALIKQHPDFYWGYRVLAVSMIEDLLPETQDSYIKSADYPGDKAAISAGLKLYPEDGYLNLCQFHILRQAQDQAAADVALLKITDPDILSNNWQTIQDYFVASKDIALMKTLLGRITLSSGSEDEESRQNLYHYQVISNLGQMEEYQAIDAYLKENPDALQGSYAQQAMISVYLDTNRQTEALELLQSRIIKGVDTYPVLVESSYNQTLKDNPRWEQLLSGAKFKWNSEKPKRKAEALKIRINTPAPTWELKDANGQLVKLSELKGKVVILDFWATWCGPCRKAMPALDSWMKNEMPQGVEVYSINVWENDPDKAKAFFAENGYAMSLLFGDNELAAQYGIQGIPYICAIDKQGRLAFDYPGYSPTLEETIGFWAEALLAE